MTLNAEICVRCVKDYWRERILKESREVMSDAHLDVLQNCRLIRKIGDRLGVCFHPLTGMNKDTCPFRLEHLMAEQEP
jgi:hypothetical protein